MAECDWALHLGGNVWQGQETFVCITTELFMQIPVMFNNPGHPDFFPPLWNTTLIKCTDTWKYESQP